MNFGPNLVLNYCMDLKSIKTKAFQAICRQYGVRELYVFGSVATDRFTEESDMDFLVDFNRESPNGAFDQFMGLKMALEAELGHSVDLLTLKPFRNPLFQQEIDRTKVLVYSELYLQNEYDMKVPNEVTQKTILEAKSRVNVVTSKNANQLFVDLDI